MNLSQAISIHAGGLGSGCRGDNCGRKGSGPSKLSVDAIDRLMVAHYRIESSPLRAQPYSDKVFKWQDSKIRDLHQMVEKAAIDIGVHKVAGIVNLLKMAKNSLYNAKGLNDQEYALTRLHETIRHLPGYADWAKKWGIEDR